MVFNPDSTKHIQEVFLKTPQEVFLPNLYFNKFVIEKMQTQKHLGAKVDTKKVIKIVGKVNRRIGNLKKLSRF